jgi:hypothetical protein
VEHNAASKSDMIIRNRGKAGCDAAIDDDYTQINVRPGKEGIRCKNYNNLDLEAKGNEDKADNHTEVRLGVEKSKLEDAKVAVYFPEEDKVYLRRFLKTPMLLDNFKRIEFPEICVQFREWYVREVFVNKRQPSPQIGGSSKLAHTQSNFISQIPFRARS